MSPRQIVRGAPAFDRIPQQIAAGRPFREGLCEASGQTVKFVLPLVRRINQHQTAPFFRRHEGWQRGPAIEVDDAGLGVAAQGVDQALARIRFDLARGQAILWPQQGARDQRRAGIGLQVALRIEGPDDVEIGF